jgi:hypothetical protein
MTQHETMQAIRKLGLTCGRTAYGEYRVNLRLADGGSEATAYYTDDAEDALATACYMLRFKAS